MQSPLTDNPQALSEATAIRLFNSVVVSEGQSGRLPPLAPSIPSIDECKSVASVQSANEFGNSCRICRWNRSDMQILRCPCRCKGSVGYVHLQCLKRWILHRRDNRCEICNTQFEIPDEKLSIRRMLSTLFCARCGGAILKNLLFGASLVPLAHVVLQQVLLCMDNINSSPNEQLTLQEVIMASCALLTSSALFFHYFEYITTRFLIIRNILRQWWMFGNTENFPSIDLESDSYDMF